MNKVFFLWTMLLMIVISTGHLNAQEDKSARPSPPAVASAKVGQANIAINYSSPAVKGRTIWGELVPYGKVWRTGANEATTFETSTDLDINGHKLPAGKYALFTIPGEKEWTVIFNSVWDQWGAFKYDQSKDVLRFNVVPQKAAAFNERMKFDITDHVISLLWENLQISFVAK